VDPDLEIQIAILTVLEKYYSTEESRAYVDKDYIRSVTCIPSALFEKNLAYLLDKQYVQYPPKRTDTSFRGIRITAEGVCFKQIHKNIELRVEHLWKLKERVIKPLMRNISELVISPTDVIFGSWTKRVVYFGQDPLERIHEGVDRALYEDVVNHFPSLGEELTDTESKLKDFATKRKELQQSLESDFSSLSESTDSIPVAIAGLFSRYRLTPELENKYDFLDRYISQTSRAKFNAMKESSEICEEALRGLWTVLNSLTFVYRLTNQCAHVPTVSVGFEKAYNSDLEFMREQIKSLSLDVRDLKALLAQISVEHREYLEKIVCQQDKILQFKLDLQSIRNALPSEEAGTLKEIEEQVDRFTRWAQFGEVVAKLWQIGCQYASSHPDALRIIGCAITKLIFGRQDVSYLSGLYKAISGRLKSILSKITSSSMVA
jgi:hypothetical protein